MMKNTVFLMIILAFCSWGCSKTAPEEPSGNPPTGCTPQFPDKQVTYNGYVKNIITLNCTQSCHKGGNSLGTGNFTTYAGVKPYADQFPLRVISDNADMPQGGVRLPKAVRDSLNIWVKNCAPEN
ncbi:hypothetical protein [Solitalea canadensis]|uniref:Cytochrome c domain-containing protein n=1 Tax=Solitalea canadensis (strain ATCC 29591 / DSM 3403 / JCM 21819 / LMG 8368 / NBRC 15130 / NCIMB 12057 / USAM 9D) TaxID=929556 RepID=H8KSJ7_SOLCM|nr:hypothetical protein [Solitalea canadensis]AFD08548.1 hypothetical protein Solca_3544 [Solitalea canadensis DSM 3403]